MIPFEPFAYDHAASLIGLRPWTVSRQADLLFQAFSRAISRYQLRQCIVGIDIYNVEAEAFGCVVAEPEGNGSPSVSGPICCSQVEIKKLKIGDLGTSRFPWILSTADKLRASFPSCAVRMPLTGPFTLAGHMIGLDNLLCDLLLNEDETRASLEYLAERLLEFVRRIGKQGFEITLFESSASPPMVSPGLFHSMLQPVLHKLVSEIARLTGSPPQFIMGGNTLPILEGIISINPSYIICPIETDQSRFMSEIQRINPDVHVRVNLPPGAFKAGSKEDVIREVDRTFQLAKMWPRTSIGTILPFDASPELVDLASAHLNAKQSF